MTYNKKSISPVISFIVWLVVFAIICVVGISNVFAATYDATTYTAQLYDNYGPSLHDVSTEFSNMSWRGTIPNMQANTSGAAWGVSSPIPLLKNHTYSMTIRIDGNYGGNIVLSTFNRIGLGTSLASAKTSYESNTNSTLEYSNVVSSSSSIQFAFTSSINANYIVFPFATNYTGDFQSFYLYNLIIEDLGSSSDVSQTTINNSLNNQTTEINTSITNSENNIKGSIKESENNIKDGIKEGFESCRDSYNLFNKNSTFKTNGATKEVLDTGVRSKLVNSGNYRYFSVELGKSELLGKTIILNRTITNSSSNIGQIALYFGNETSQSKKIIFADKKSGTSNIYIPNTFPENCDRIWILFYGNVAGTGNVGDYTDYSDLMISFVSSSYEEYGKQVCKNRLDEANETSKGILGKIKDLFNWLTNKDDADISGAGNVAGWLPSGPVDSLITLPLTFLTNVNTSLSKTCAPLDVNLPYVNKNIQIPCLNTIFNQITGLNSFWTWVGTISSVVILFKYLVALYDYFDRLTTLQANFISDWGGI